jgi:hypothetical protein
MISYLRHVAELLFSTMLSFNDHEKCNAHTKASARRTARNGTEFSWTKRIERSIVSTPVDVYFDRCRNAATQ